MELSGESIADVHKKSNITVIMGRKSKIPEKY